MNAPTVSVIIPAYKQAGYVGEAVRSVLDQTFGDLEVIVVDDHSPDATAEIVRQFADPRVRLIVHDKNRMLAAARNTGLRAARGTLFALLDADDYFAKDKLQCHVDYLQQHPEVGVSYNGRYELRCDNQRVRNLSRVAPAVTLADLVLGFPFYPSDMVLRREAAFAVDLFDESYVHFSEDLDINCRLALAGCRFGGIDHCLSYRRFLAGRIIRNPRQRLEGALAALRKVMADPHTPPDVLALQNRAYANNYVVWGIEALRGGDTATGLEFSRAALRYQPAVIEGSPNELTTYMVYEAAHDDTADLPQVYEEVVAQLTGEFVSVQHQMAWGIGRAWLIRAYRSLIWGSLAAGRDCLAAAAAAGAELDQPYLDEVIHQLLGVEMELGRKAAEEAAARLDEQFRSIMGRTAQPSFVAALELGRAYAYYHSGRHKEVPAQVLRAIRSNPRCALSRGSLSIFMRAALQSGRVRSGMSQNV
jgi:hypothetical protein